MQWTDRIGRRVKLRDLHIFLAVAQSGSMAKAAAQLAVSQPVVSKTIADLEHALGVRLLDRTFQGIEPTAYGRAFVTCGEAVFDDMRRGVQQLEFLADPTSGELHIGCATPLVDGVLPTVLDRLTARYPRINCYLVDGDSPMLARLLRERKIDIAVSRTWGSHFGDDFSAEFLFDESLFVVAGLTNPWTSRRAIDLKELLDEPWTLPDPDTPIAAMVRDGFRRAGLTLPVPQVVSASMAVRIRLIEGGRYLTLLPGSVLYFGEPGRKVKALPVSLPLQPQAFEIITLRDRAPNPITTLFANELRALLKPMIEHGIAMTGTSKKRSKTAPVKALKRTV
jgi:DNA-binding transcriptional LysR family regulator